MHFLSLASLQEETSDAARFFCECSAAGNVVPRGLKPRTLRLLAVRSNQLSYETS